jgi:oxygen-dependent protoporphyrinogen oxidase
MPRIVVVGGGISGLAVAYHLERSHPAADVIVLEQQARLGGTIDTVSRDGFVVESGPNGFLDSNPVTFELARTVGLHNRLLAASPVAARNRFLLLDGRLRMLPNSFGSFLKSDLLSWIGKIDLLAERFRPRRTSKADESIDSFIRRRGGREIALLADAFVTGILAGDAKLLSMPASFPRFAGFERDFGSVSAGMKHAARERRALFRGNPQPRRAGRMWSFQGGLSTLVEGVASHLRRQPITGAAVRRVSRKGDSYLVEGEGRDSWQADGVVLACPAYRQAEILADLDAPLAEAIGAIQYNRLAVIALGYKENQVPHALDGFGYLSPQRARRDVLGVQWCSSIFPDRAPEGMVLVRAMCGGWHRGDMVDWPDDRLIAAVRDELAQTIGVRTPPVFHHIVRWRRAIPQYFLGHLEGVEWINQRLSNHPGLFAGGNAYRGVAINDCVEQGQWLAARVAKWLGSSLPPLTPAAGERGRG